MVIIKFNTKSNQLEINGNWTDQISFDKEFAPNPYEEGILVFSGLDYMFTVDKKNQLLGIASSGNINHQKYQTNEWETYKPISQENDILNLVYEKKCSENNTASLDGLNWVKGNIVRNWEISFKKNIRFTMLLSTIIIRRQNLDKLEKFMGGNQTLLSNSLLLRLSKHNT